jgi:hypothetical protein
LVEAALCFSLQVSRVIRPAPGKRKDWQYYQRAGKKLSIAGRDGSFAGGICASLIASYQTFLLALVVLPVSLPFFMANYRSAIKEIRGTRQGGSK